jgi:hypothetical protein
MSFGSVFLTVKGAGTGVGEGAGEGRKQDHLWDVMAEGIISEGRGLQLFSVRCHTVNPSFNGPIGDQGWLHDCNSQKQTEGC